MEIDKFWPSHGMKTVYYIYDGYKKTQLFPKLLDSPKVLSEDKQKIKRPTEKAMESIRQETFCIDR